jgi:DNA-binding response OmpR family regulator
MRILLVEDSARLHALISEAMRKNGFTVDVVTLAEDARSAVASTLYDAVILDLGLPDSDGMTVLAAVRAGRKASTPVIVLTARDTSDAIVAGLNGGADDYLCKPFVMDELIARLRAVLRRPGRALNSLMREGNLELNTVDRVVTIAGATVELSRRELSALELLMRRSGRVISKAEMEESLYGYGEEVASNAIEVVVHRLRKKLSSAEASAELHTLRGIGYLLSDPAR